MSKTIIGHGSGSLSCRGFHIHSQWRDIVPNDVGSDQCEPTNVNSTQNPGALNKGMIGYPVRVDLPAVIPPLDGSRVSAHRNSLPESHIYLQIVSPLNRGGRLTTAMQTQGYIQIASQACLDFPFALVV